MYDTKQYKNYNLSIEINKKLKHSYLSVTKEGKLKIKTPISSQKFIATFIDEREEWILKQLQKIKNCKKLGNIELHTQESIEERVLYFSQKMSLPYSQLKFRKMKRRWGSCSSCGVITLNRALFYVASELVDYVIVHELAHLRHMNHSKEFHSLVKSYLPEEKKYRISLQEIDITW